MGFDHVGGIVISPLKPGTSILTSIRMMIEFAKKSSSKQQSTDLKNDEQSLFGYRHVYIDIDVNQHMSSETLPSWECIH